MKVSGLRLDPMNAILGLASTPSLSQPRAKVPVVVTVTGLGSPRGCTQGASGWPGGPGRVGQVAVHLRLDSELGAVPEPSRPKVVEPAAGIAPS
jgi:hypothetical protein